MALDRIKFNIASFNDADAGGNNYYAGIVYEIFNSNDTLADIYSDAAGANPINQDGISNKSNSSGEVVFYIDSGDYYIKVNEKVEYFSTLLSSGALINDLSLPYVFDTVADMVASVITFPAGKVIIVKERTTGNGGGAMWDTVLTSSVSVDSLFVVQSISVPTLSFHYRINESTVYADQIGILPGSGQESEISKFLEYIHDNQLKGVMRKGQYDVEENLLTKTTTGVLILVCQDGEVDFNYVGTEIQWLIVATECLAAQLMNITFNCNDLIAAPLDIRITTGTGRTASYFNVKSFNVKQTTLTTSAIGLQTIGEYRRISYIDCVVEDVTFTTSGRAATGIGASDFGGIFEMKGCVIKRITTPTGIDADGVKVFGTDVGTPTAYLGARAEIHNNVIEDCQGRFIKMQISDFEIHGNQFKLSTGFSTITEWRGVDGQSSNGDVHHNTFRIGSGVTWGANATFFSMQNNRNDGGSKVTNINYNRIHSSTDGCSHFVTCSVDNGDNAYNITYNEILGATIKEGVSLRAISGAANIDSCDLTVNNNTFKGITSQNLFDPFDGEDFGDKLYLEFCDNRVIDASTFARFYNSLAGFSVNANFKLANNENVDMRVNWEFDMDELPGGNAFRVGGQSIANKGPVMTTFFHVKTDQYQQWNIDAVDTDRRVSDTGATWNAWVSL